MLCRLSPGADYLPFAEIPSLRNMVLTGEDDGDMSYMSVMQSPYAQPLPMNHPTDNRTPVEFGRPGPQQALGGPGGPFQALQGPSGGGGSSMGQFPPGRGRGGALGPRGPYPALQGPPGGPPYGQFPPGRGGGGGGGCSGGTCGFRPVYD